MDGGYLLNGSAWLYTGPQMMIIGIRGKVAAGNEACLAWLLPRAEARLRHRLAETATGGDTEDRSELWILINIDDSSALSSIWTYAIDSFS